MDGAIYPIRQLIDDPVPAYMSDAYDLNDQGQILAVGLVYLPAGYGVWLLTPQVAPAADLNNDCVVDGADLLLLEAWGNPARPEADLNKDGKVNGADLGLLLAAWTVEG